MIDDSRTLAIRPFLTQSAIAREPEGIPLPGAYSSKQGVWLVDVGQGAQPIVDVRRNLGETSTFTKVSAEHDDADVTLASIGETATTTRMQTEVDDADITAATLDIATKTYAQLESEDVAFEIETAASEDARYGGIVFPIQ